MTFDRTTEDAGAWEQAAQRPLLPDHPVIVTHVADNNYPWLSMCGGALTTVYAEQYPKVPRYLCPLCEHYVRGCRGG